MTATLKNLDGGRGLQDNAATGSGGLSDEDFRTLSVNDGLATITGDLALDKPDIENLDFPGPVAEAMYWDDSAVVGINGPVGSGKTTTLLKSRLRRAKMMPMSVIDGVRRYKLLGIRATYRQLWSTTIPDFLKVFPKDLGEWSGGRGGPVNFVMLFEDEHGPIEFTVEFMAFGDDVVAAMRGIQTTDIWLHEMDTNPLDVLVNGITRIKRFPDQAHFKGYPAKFRDYGQLVGDFNAPDEDNWSYGFFYDEEKRKEAVDNLNVALKIEAEKAGTNYHPIEIGFHKQPGYGEKGCENLINLPASYYPTQIATMKLAGRGDLVKRLVYNLTVYLKVGVPVFEAEFSRQIHVSPTKLQADPNRPLFIGLDQGFKGAAVIAQYYEPGRWVILAELMFPKKRLFAHTFGEHLRALLKERFPGIPVGGVWGDMAGEHGASQSADENATWNLMVGKAAGFRVKPQRIGTNRIQPRLEAIRAQLEYIRGGKPGILIDPSCKYLIAGFEARYVWAEEINASGDKRKVPDKRMVEANVMDALQYLFLSKAKPDGSSPNSFGRAPVSEKIGHNGGPPMSGGLMAKFDVTNPYGE